MFRIKAVKEKCDNAIISLVSSTQLKFKSEQLANLKSWQVYMVSETERVEETLKDPESNKEEFLQSLDEGTLEAHLTEVWSQSDALVICSLSQTLCVITLQLKTRLKLTPAKLKQRPEVETLTFRIGCFRALTKMFFTTLT